jgi:hypothetical protein
MPVLHVVDTAVPFLSGAAVEEILVAATADAEVCEVLGGETAVSVTHPSGALRGGPEYAWCSRYLVLLPCSLTRHVRGSGAHRVGAGARCRSAGVAASAPVCCRQ